MSPEATGDGNSRERLTLAALLLPSSRAEECAPDAWVDCYDMDSFRSGVASIRPRAALGAEARSVAPGDVLLSRLVTAPRRAWVVDRSRGRPQLASSDWLVLRSDRFDPHYLRHLLVSNVFHLCVEHAAATRRRRHVLAAADVADIRIFLPCRESQARLGRVLQHADALRAKRQAVAARLARLPAAAAAEMRQVARDAGWPQVRLGELLVEGAPEPARDADANGSWLLVRAAQLEDDGVDAAGCAPASQPDEASRDRIVADGDLLISRPQRGDRPRVVVAYPGAARWLAHQEIVKLSVNIAKVHPEYIRAVLASDASPWVSVPGVRPRTARSPGDLLRRLEAVEVPLPPAAAQARMTAIAAAATTLQTKLQASARQLDALLGTLRDVAFRGEL